MSYLDHPKADMFLRAAKLHAEKVLHHIPHASVSEIASAGMIRKRWIKEALRQHPNASSFKIKGRTVWRMDLPSTHPYSLHTERMGLIFDSQDKAKK